MSVDRILQDMIRDEVNRALAPVMAALDEMRENNDLKAQLSSLLGGQPVRRGPGRPRKNAYVIPLRADASPAPRRGPGRPPGSGKVGRPRSEARGCALQGCRRPARSKGFCAAHYQKYRMLSKTNRLPSDWKADAAPGSIKDIVLPRGRAGAKALAEAKKK